MKLELLLLVAVLGATSADAAPARVALGEAEAPLTGPWAFQLGDDPRWASPAFDDAAWERVDLTPAAGATDPDVGLVGYVGGWMERGHPGYHGFAWYRLRVAWTAAPGQDLVLVGPTLVDDAYELYWDGQRVGGSGDFTGGAPPTYATRPAVFAVPTGHATAGEAVVAVRVYLSPGVRRGGDAGGMHVAPILAGARAGAARHTAQWWQTFWGYVVDVVEPALFVMLAWFAGFVGRLERERAFHRWLVAALVLTAALRVNQAIYFWLAVEELSTFVWVKGAVLQPLGLLAWIWTWNRWRSSAPWIDRGAAGLAIASAVAALAGFSGVRAAARIALAIVMGVAGAAIARRGPDRILAVLALLLVATGQFAEELSALGCPGIWFPFGVGVSRTQFAYAAVLPLLALLLARRALRGSRKEPRDASP